MSHENEVQRLMREAHIVAHYARTFAPHHALTVLHPRPGQRFHRLAEAAAHLMLEPAE